MKPQSDTEILDTIEDFLENNFALDDEITNDAALEMLREIARILDGRNRNTEESQ